MVGLTTAIFSFEKGTKAILTNLKGHQEFFFQTKRKHRLTLTGDT